MTWLAISLIVLIILSGFFSSSEIGLMAVNRYRVKHLADSGDKPSKRIQALLSRPDRLLGVILIGNTFANIAASALATTIASHLYGDIGIAVATIVLTFIILIFAEIMPKTVAALHSLALASKVSLPLMILLKILYPIVWLTNTISNNLLKIFGVRVGKIGQESLSPDELRSVVSETKGVLPKHSKNMLLGVLDLKKVTVNDIMTARNHVTGIDLNNDDETILKHLSTAQHSLLPIYYDDIDNIIGVIHVRRALALFNNPNIPHQLKTIAYEPYFIPEYTPLTTQLIHFKKVKHQAAFVVDEYGDIQGMITITDILEEIVGEYSADSIAISKDISPQEDGSFLVSGNILLRDLNRDMRWSLPTDGPKTLNGLIIEHLGHIPRSGSSIKIEGLIIEMMRVADNKVQTVKIRKP